MIKKRKTPLFNEDLIHTVDDAPETNSKNHLKARNTQRQQDEAMQ